ncbi:nuclease [Frankia sp. AgB32]|uniref:nuclease n=1 Tax=Frankia sp. AgB32 TaxID=631119 RepID=UPI0020100B55|nr:nuclease [Frankia sp. AgB32]MCK9894953.1 nuclease [Frankia sp. AgB32]
MPLTLIAGTFRIVGASPDGDSVRFYPHDRQAFAHARIAVKANASGGVQLRLDAIDALETHYTPPHTSHSWHQRPEFGAGAAGALLRELGFTDVTRNTAGTVTAATPTTVDGYILTRFADTYGRAVAMVFAADPPAGTRDGGPLFLDVDGLHHSVNHRLLAAGWVYPTFYSKLYVDLRADLAATAAAARRAGTGIWKLDATTAGFTVVSRDALTEDLVILPKLFRRLAEYLSLDETGGVDLTGFPAFLTTLDDRLFTVPTGQATALDTLVTVTDNPSGAGQTVTLTVPPEQTVFLES